MPVPGGQSGIRPRTGLRSPPRQGHDPNYSSPRPATRQAIATEQSGENNGLNNSLEEGKENNNSGSNFSSPRAQKRRIIGFDNSDKNLHRPILGSCTDRVAEDRVKYGPWQAPDRERQRRLVDRLAPFKPAHPPDPRFNTWVNHFEYYWRIGVDEKPTRRRVDRLSSSSTSSTNNDSYRGSSNSSADQDGRLYRTQYHRLLGKRPKTTPGRLMEASNGGNDGTMDGASNGHNGEGRTYYGDASEDMPGGYDQERPAGTADTRRSLPVISGLDRRYMGLQSVNSHEMKDIVGRLTRLTSAYHAKFAPNPHVWIDNSPGAHMVAKRENTIA